MDDLKELINKYIDNKLSNKDKIQLQKIIREDEKLKNELKEFDEIKEVISMLKTQDPDKDWEKYWSHLYNRLERGIGWIITSIGAILLLTFAGFQFVKELIRDPELALYAKIGILALVLGIVILFVSIIRERIFISKTDKYSKEVKR
jgi:hypothetical protein